MSILVWLARITRRAAEPTLCPSCIWIRDDRGEVVELIDCRTLSHHVLEKP